MQYSPKAVLLPENAVPHPSAEAALSLQRDQRPAGRPGICCLSPLGPLMLTSLPLSRCGTEERDVFVLAPGTVDDEAARAIAEASVACVSGLGRRARREAVLAANESLRGVASAQPEEFWRAIGATSCRETAAFTAAVIGRSKQFVYAEERIDRLPEEIKSLYDRGSVPARSLRPVMAMGEDRVAAIARLLETIEMLGARCSGREALDAAVLASDPNERDRASRFAEALLSRGGGRRG